jgi:hypothetical protein
LCARILLKRFGSFSNMIFLAESGRLRCSICSSSSSPSSSAMTLVPLFAFAGCFFFAAAP